MNYYPRHIGDYLKDTAGLTLAEHGAYSLLMDHYYNAERPLPRDLDECCKLLRITKKFEKNVVEHVLALYFTRTEDGHHQKRIDEEISIYLVKSAKARASADARWKPKDAKPKPDANAFDEFMRTHGGNNANASAEGMRTHGKANANAMLTNNQEPITKNQEPRLGCAFAFGHWRGRLGGTVPFPQDPHPPAPGGCRWLVLG